jgi:predicted  nucleic acid-binding Zn-ribbon protein
MADQESSIEARIWELESALARAYRENTEQAAALRHARRHVLEQSEQVAALRQEVAAIRAQAYRDALRDIKRSLPGRAARVLQARMPAKR